MIIITLPTTGDIKYYLALIEFLKQDRKISVSDNIGEYMFRWDTTYDLSEIDVIVEKLCEFDYLQFHDKSMEEGDYHSINMMYTKGDEELFNIQLQQRGY